MRIGAHAPGKVVVLGEYAVLDGAPALVMAVDRRAHARIEPSGDGLCHLETRAPQPSSFTAPPGQPLGVGLVDAVCSGTPPVPPWRATVDSAALWSGGRKLGLGSSAAALCAWAGAFCAYARASGHNEPERPDAAALIGLHRALQGGVGSGLDVAASLTGGLVIYRLSSADVPHIGSVQMPNGVAFAGIFAGSSASTPDFVARYRAWRAGHPRRAAERLRALGKVADAGCVAVREGDGESFLAALEEYGRCLDVLGEAFGADIVTAEHREIAEEARRHGVAYKVSGAGGGDLGLAASLDQRALHAFELSVAGKGYRVIDFRLDRQGLVVEERAE